MDGYRVFLDESGKLNNQNDTAPTLAAVFIPENSLDAIKFDFAELTKSAKKWGANTSDPKFEFSTRHILSDNDANRSHFAGVPHNHSMKILKKMALIISRHRLLTLTTCFKRPEADRSAEAIFNTSPDGFDSRFHLPGLFIGLLAGMSAREGFSSALVADKDFFQNGIWHDALRLTVDVWPQLRGKGLFPTWSRVSDPLWLIGKDLTECESYQECGIQLADLLANTVRRINRGSRNATPSYELKEGSLKEAPGFKFGMPGINVFLQMHQDSQNLNRRSGQHK